MAKLTQIATLDADTRVMAFEDEMGWYNRDMPVWRAACRLLKRRDIGISGLHSSPKIQQLTVFRKRDGMILERLWVYFK